MLGNKYEFNEIELNKLRKKFNSICFLDYDGSRESSIKARKEIKDLISKQYHKYLVINSDYNVDKKMIRFLTLLQFRYRKKSLKVISIQKFLEKILYKLYIPDDNKNLEFLTEIRPYNLMQYSTKRIIDVLGGGLLYTINFFLKFYIKKRINKESPGSVYFIQKRVGLYNKEFECIKYRSMYLDAEKNGIKFASKNDDRIFPFGKFMRKTRIDEIPQAINVLKGEMHLIGPRPERMYWVQQFEKEIPYYSERHIVKPGITGWAQVNYPYGDSSEDAKQKLMYDLYYIKHWSPWLEIVTIFKTIAVMVNRKGI